MNSEPRPIYADAATVCVRFLEPPEAACETYRLDLLEQTHASYFQAYLQHHFHYLLWKLKGQISKVETRNTFSRRS